MRCMFFFCTVIICCCYVNSLIIPKHLLANTLAGTLTNTFTKTLMNTSKILQQAGAHQWRRHCHPWHDGVRKSVRRKGVHKGVRRGVRSGVRLDDNRLIHTYISNQFQVLFCKVRFKNYLVLFIFLYFSMFIFVGIFWYIYMYIYMYIFDICISAELNHT